MVARDLRISRLRYCAGLAYPTTCLDEGDPSLGFLWLGAFIIGAQTRALQEARQAWWKIDLHVAVWTGTLMSFIQEPVSTLPPRTEEISRADECRLMYLSHD